MLDNLFAPDKLILIAIVGLVLFGPKRLPQIGRSVGKWLGEFRKAAGGLGDELKAGMNDHPAPAASAAAEGTTAVVATSGAAQAVEVEKPGPAPASASASVEPGQVPPAP